MQPFCKKLRRLQFINANCTIKDKNIYFLIVCGWLLLSSRDKTSFLLATHNSFYPIKDRLYPVFAWIKHNQEPLTWQQEGHVSDCVTVPLAVATHYLVHTCCQKQSMISCKSSNTLQSQWATVSWGAPGCVTVLHGLYRTQTPIRDQDSSFI